MSADPEARPGGAGTAGSPSSAASAPPARPRLVFDDPLDQRSADDTDDGWGERPASGSGAADLARFLDEKPPHHI
jgi:hypothetical protein